MAMDLKDWGKAIASTTESVSGPHPKKSEAARRELEVALQDPDKGSGGVPSEKTLRKKEAKQRRKEERERKESVFQGRVEQQDRHGEVQEEMKRSQDRGKRAVNEDALAEEDVPSVSRKVHIDSSTKETATTASEISNDIHTPKTPKTPKKNTSENNLNKKVSRENINTPKAIPKKIFAKNMSSYTSEKVAESSWSPEVPYTPRETKELLKKVDQYRSKLKEKEKISSIKNLHEQPEYIALERTLNKLQSLLAGTRGEEASVITHLVDTEMRRIDSRFSELDTVISSGKGSVPMRETAVTEKKKGWWNGGFFKEPIDGDPASKKKDSEKPITVENKDPKKEKNEVASDTEDMKETYTPTKKETLPGGLQEEVSSMRAQTKRITDLLNKRRSHLDLSHKDAKTNSENYKHARAKLTQISRRLTAIESGSPADIKIEEINGLRSDLAQAVWDVRADMPLQVPGKNGENSNEETSSAITDPSAEGVEGASVEKGSYWKVDAEVMIDKPDGTQLKAVIVDNSESGKYTVSWKEGDTELSEILPSEKIHPLPDLSHDEMRVENYSENISDLAADVESRIPFIENKGKKLAAELLILLETGKEALKEHGPLSPEFGKINTEYTNVFNTFDQLTHGYDDSLDEKKERGLQYLQKSYTELKEKVEASSALSDEEKTDLLAAMMEGKNGVINTLANAETEQDAIFTAADSWATLADELEQVLEGKKATSEIESGTGGVENGEGASEKVLLFGSAMPKAGAEARFGVRAFREGLLLEMGRVKDIESQPELKAQFDHILKIVGYVPDSGLTEDEVATLTEIARSINISKSMFGFSKGTPPVENTPPPATEDAENNPPPSTEETGFDIKQALERIENLRSEVKNNILPYQDNSEATAIQQAGADVLESLNEVESVYESGKTESPQWALSFQEKQDRLRELISKSEQDALDQLTKGNTGEPGASEDFGPKNPEQAFGDIEELREYVKTAMDPYKDHDTEEAYEIKKAGLFVLDSLGEAENFYDSGSKQTDQWVPKFNDQMDEFKDLIAQAEKATASESGDFMDPSGKSVLEKDHPFYETQKKYSDDIAELEKSLATGDELEKSHIKKQITALSNAFQTHKAEMTEIQEGFAKGEYDKTDASVAMWNSEGAWDNVRTLILEQPTPKTESGLTLPTEPKNSEQAFADIETSREVVKEMMDPYAEGNTPEAYAIRQAGQRILDSLGDAENLYDSGTTKSEQLVREYKERWDSFEKLVGNAEKKGFFEKIKSAGAGAAVLIEKAISKISGENKEKTESKKETYSAVMQALENDKKGLNKKNTLLGLAVLLNILPPVNAVDATEKNTVPAMTSAPSMDTPGMSALDTERASLEQSGVVFADSSTSTERVHEVSGLEQPSKLDQVIAIQESGDRAYTVSKTDNLWNYAEGEVVGKAHMSQSLREVPQDRRNEVLSTVRDVLIHSSEWRDKIGIQVHPDKIYPGDVLNGTQLDELITQVAKERNII